MKKVLFVLIAAITLTACTKSSTDYVEQKEAKTALYWRIEATETDGNVLYSNVAVTKN